MSQSKKLKELNENYGRVLTVKGLLEKMFNSNFKSDIEGDFIYVHENDVIENIGVDVVSRIHNLKSKKQKQVNFNELTESIFTELKEESNGYNLTKDNVYVMLYN